MLANAQGRNLVVSGVIANERPATYLPTVCFLLVIVQLDCEICVDVCLGP